MLIFVAVSVRHVFGVVDDDYNDDDIYDDGDYGDDEIVVVVIVVNAVGDNDGVANIEHDEISQNQLIRILGGNSFDVSSSNFIRHGHHSLRQMRRRYSRRRYFNKMLCCNH